MKRLLFLLLFIFPFMVPPGALASPGTGEKALEKERAKAKKDAIKKLKNLLILTYRNWYWSGNVFKHEIDEIYTLNLISGEYFYFYMLLVADKSGHVDQFMIRLPESYVPNYEEQKNGEKTLKIEGRFEGGERFKTTLHSEGDPHEWYFWPGDLKTADGKPVDFKQSLFSSQKLSIRFQTDQRSRYKGNYEIISFDITGAKEAHDAAEAIFPHIIKP